jgi:hypothetical protein
MASDPNAPRSRRALLTAAAGGAAAFAVTATMPLTAAAADGEPVLVGADHTGSNETSIVVTADDTDPQIAFRGHAVNPNAAGLIGSSGDEAASSEDTPFTGVYGWSVADPVDALGSGVWGDSPDTGVVGTGSIGVFGVGGIGVWGSGSGAPGVIGESDTSTVSGVLARGSSTTGLALSVIGKTKFSRSGRTTIGSGRSSLTVSLPGTTSSSKVFAVLHSNRSGRYVRAVVPTTNSFTVYLNAAVTSASFVAWFVLD